MLVAAFRGLCAVLGFTCIAIAILLYPNEKHRLHVWLEESWLRVDDRGHQEQDRVDAFVDGIARSITELYDHILGKRLFSERVLVVSFFVGFISSNVFFNVQLHAKPSSRSTDEWLRVASTIPIYFVMAMQVVYGVLLWLYVRYERKKSWLHVFVRIIVIAIVLMNMVMAFAWRGWMALLLTLLGFFLAMSASVAGLAAIRVLIRQASRTHVPVSRVLYLLGSLFIGSALLVLILNSHFLQPAHQRSQMLRHAFEAVGFILVINGMSLLIIGTLLLGSFLLLIYRITWPTLSRVTYFIPGDRLVYNSRLLLSLAFALLGVAVGTNLFFPTVRPANTVCLSADLWGTVTTHGEPTDVWFEWGTTTAFGRTTAHRIFNKDMTYRQSLINLDDGTTYYWRAVVANHLGRAYGKVRTFTTPTLPPGVEYAC